MLTCQAYLVLVFPWRHISWGLWHNWLDLDTIFECWHMMTVVITVESVIWLTQSQCQQQRSKVVAFLSSQTFDIFTLTMVGQLLKNPPAMQETPVQFLGSEDPLEKGIGYPLQYSWASLVAQSIKNPPAMQETWVQSQGWEDPLEEGMATHSSILALTEEPGGLQSMGSQRVEHDWVIKHSTCLLVKKLTSYSERCQCAVIDRGWASWMASSTQWT